MFSLMPFGFMFLSVLVFGTVLSLSSLHWLAIWAGLEINLMGFIPILVYSGISRETESGMKYFIVQALGSGMIMTGSLLSFNSLLTWEHIAQTSPQPGFFLLVFGLILKLGGSPFHFWLPSVMAGISWMSCLLLTTWQKLAPLFLLSTLIMLHLAAMAGPTTTFLMVAATLSALVGGIGGLNQTQVRALLAYSSIGHMGWMLLCITVSSSALKIYFIVYFTVSVCTFLALWKSEKSLYQQFGRPAPNLASTYELVIVIMLLSLGGMPPLLGFYGKWTAIWASSVSLSLVSLLPLLIGSLISLFYYLSLLFSTALLSHADKTGLSPLSSAAPFTFEPVNSPATLSITIILAVNLVGGIFILMALPLYDFL